MLLANLSLHLFSDKSDHQQRERRITSPSAPDKRWQQRVEGTLRSYQGFVLVPPALRWNLHVFEDRGAVGPSHFTVVLKYIVNQPSRASIDAIGDLLNTT